MFLVVMSIFTPPFVIVVVVVVCLFVFSFGFPMSFPPVWAESDDNE